MTIPIDIFRMETKGVVWVESAPTLVRARSRVEELLKCTPGDYLLLNHTNGEKVVIKASGLDEALSNQGIGQSAGAEDVQKGTKFSQPIGG